MKKSRKILLIMAFVVLLGLINMPNKVFGVEDGEITSITIGTNSEDSVTSVKLILDEYETQQLKVNAKNNNNESIENPTVTWSSSDDSIVSVSSSGLITAKKEGTATITASAGNVNSKVKVEVSAISFADFSDVEYKWNVMFNSSYYLQLLSNKAYTEKSNFYFTITKSNEKPKLVFDESGKINASESRNSECII